jgi:hypothetical protein
MSTITLQLPELEALLTRTGLPAGVAIEICAR